MYDSRAGTLVISPELADTALPARLLQHTDVALAAVVALPDEAGLDRPVACVVRQPNATVTADELITFCRDGLAHFKCPRTVLFADELPLTATGKVRRNVIRQQAAQLLPGHQGGHPTPARGH